MFPSETSLLSVNIQDLVRPGMEVLEEPRRPGVEVLEVKFVSFLTIEDSSCSTVLSVCWILCFHEAPNLLNWEGVCSEPGLFYYESMLYNGCRMLFSFILLFF